MCVISLICLCLICLCKCVLSLDCSFIQKGFLNTCKNIILQHSYRLILSIYVFDDTRVNSTSIINILFWFTPPNSDLKYLYTYIRIGDKEDIHILYVYFIEIRSESCNYTFIDWRYISFEFLKFQNFNIFSINLYAKVLIPYHPLY